MLFLAELFEHVHEGGDLGRVGGGGLGLDEPGVAGGLAEPEKGLENVDLEAVDAVALDASEQLLLVVLAEPVVEGLLLALEVAGHGLLAARGELRGHELLGAPEEEGTEGAPKDGGPCAGVGRARAGAGRFLERFRAAEHAGVEELEDGPEVVEPVLDGRAGEGEPARGAQEAGGLGGLGAGVLDGLGLVEDDALELDRAKPLDVQAHGGVGGEDQVRIREAGGAGVALDAGVLHDAERGRESLGLAGPVEHERLGRDDEPGLGRGIFAARGLDGTCAMVEEMGQELDGLAQPHVVGETAAEDPKSARKRSQPSPSRW